MIQYVDDLLICSPDPDVCKQDTIALLQFLASQGHKASVAKLQFVLQKVTFLGHIITPNGRSLSEERIKAIQNMPKPITKKQMMGFLGTTGYCRQWILNYANLTQPLQDITHSHDMTPTENVTGTTEVYCLILKMQIFIL